MCATSDPGIVLDVRVNHGLDRFLQGGVFCIGSGLRRGLNFRIYMYGHGVGKLRNTVCDMFRKLAATNHLQHVIITR